MPKFKQIFIPVVIGVLLLEVALLGTRAYLLATQGFDLEIHIGFGAFYAVRGYPYQEIIDNAILSLIALPPSMLASVIAWKFIRGSLAHEMAKESYIEVKLSVVTKVAIVVGIALGIPAFYIFQQEPYGIDNCWIDHCAHHALAGAITAVGLAVIISAPLIDLSIKQFRVD